MQLCGKCGNYNSDESIFCNHCGNRLNNRCPDCGFNNLMQQKFCGSCGKHLLADGEIQGEGIPPGAPQGPPEAPAYFQQTGAVSPGQVAAMPGPPIMAPSGLEPLPQAEGDMDEARFESYADLEAYALASLEVANWEQLRATIQDEPRLMQLRRDCLRRLEERVLAEGGQINASKNGILFLSFKREASLDASLEKAVAISQDLLSERWTCEGLVLRLRIGLDIEQAANKNPLTSTLERSVALPATLTVSETVASRIADRHPLEVIGPMPMGNRMMQFYRVLRPGGEMPRAEDLLAPDTSATPAHTATPPELPTMPEHPAMSQPELPPLPESQAAPPEPVPFEPETPDIFIPQTEAEPLPEPSVEEIETPEEAEISGDASIPPPVHYDPPILGLRKTTRPPNLNYQQAIDALTAEISGFLAPGSATQGKVLFLCGADGLGKSSILNAMRAKVDPEARRAYWLIGHNYRCFQRNELLLYSWLEMIQNPLGLIPEGQNARDVREAAQHFLGTIYEGEAPAETVAFLNDFLSIRPPQPLTVESRENLGRVEDYFLDFFQRLTSRNPLIVILKDLHHADTASLELWTRLLERKLLDRPIYFIVTQSRDFYAHERLAAVLQKVPVKELVVSDLDEMEAERLLDEGPLGGQLQEFPVPLIDILLRQSHGMPIYLEEALRLLHLQEVLSVDPQTHKFVMSQEFNPLEAALPEDIHVLIRQRLTFLSDTELYVLRLAAVLGEEFPVGVLMALGLPEGAEGEDKEQFAKALNTLYDHGYLFPDAVNTGRFRHGLIWEAVYHDIEPETREQMHQLISELLESDFNQGLTVNPMLIAYHAENGRLLNRALHYWNLAGIYAGQVGSLTGMNMAMFRALELLRESTTEPLHTSELALRIVESMGSFNLEQNPDLAIEMLEWVFYYRQLEGDFTKLIEPLGFLASAYEHKGDFPRALATLDKALALIDSKMYPLEAASILINKLEHLFTLGRIQQARELMDDQIAPMAARAQTQGDEEFEDAYLNARLIQAQILLAQCDNAAINVLEDTLTQARQRGMEGLVIALQLTMGQVLLRNGQYESCNREADDLLRAIEALDEPDWFLAQWGLLAIMYHCELEEWESASQLVLRVTASAESARDYLTWAAAQTYAGHIAARMGKSKEARQLLEQAVALSSDHRFAATALLGWRFLAELELSLGGKEVGYEIAAKALDIANKPEIGNKFEAVALTLTCARCLMAQGKIKAAGKLLEPLWPQVIKTRMQPLVGDCAFEIGQLYKHLAQDAPADLSKKHLMRSVEFFLKAKSIWLELRHFPNVKRVDAVVPKL